MPEPKADPNRLPLDLQKTVAAGLKLDKHDLSPWRLAGIGWLSDLPW
jgi:hypothetical protein